MFKADSSPIILWHIFKKDSEDPYWQYLFVHTTPKQGKAVRRYVIQDADIYGIAGAAAASPIHCRRSLVWLLMAI
jgi:hypothetical protein